MRRAVLLIVTILIVLLIFKYYNTNEVKQVDDTEHIWIGGKGIKFKE